MKARALSEASYLLIKAHTRTLIKGCGGQVSAASLTRVGHASMQRYGSIESAEFMPADVTADLELELGTPVLSEAMARLSGHVLVKLPEVEHDGDMVRHIGRLTKELSDVAGGVGTCLADDGKVTRDEIKSINLRKEIHDLIKAAVMLDHALEYIEEEGE